MRSGRAMAAVVAGCCLLSGCVEAGQTRSDDRGAGAGAAEASAARASAGLASCDVPAGSSASASSSAESSGAARGRAVAGSRLPALTLACIGGAPQVSVSGELDGHPHVITMWASWCRPCRAEAPMMATVSRELDGKVGFLGIDYGERSSDDGIGFAAAAGWTYPQLEDRDAVTKSAWGITGLPVTLLVRADGTVARRLDGAWTSADQLRRAVREDLEVS
ncbi:TlpA family protein disulfide reductase [Acidipropionibacterium virtanenii]|uniref:Thiol-disulfide oxidoreductase ResA n=1 Tax=Acidipropionibacterium virtanenii TaxID=2057246 RepID=A0A344UR79_9ACTN|nr:TlpA disulfide reductase family protein [Acidipropionibacterium virtanenii]AXE37777.1 Thiol-disulfide oxidoreductase ResA [Acidipropionibacterium virtanenii]